MSIKQGFVTFFQKLKIHPFSFIKNTINSKKRSLFHYYYHRKYDGKLVYLHYPPNYITIGINGFCTNNCIFCVAHNPDAAQNSETNHQYNLAYNMTYEEFCKLVDLAYKARVPHVHMVGAGEPFLHKDVFRMMDYVISKYHFATIQSNFHKNLYESRKILDRIMERKIYIKSITSDIFPEAIHNNVKSGSDYSFLVESLEYLSKNSNIKFDLHTILTKKTYKNLDTLILDLHKRGINCELNIVNLHTYNFNDFTKENNVYIKEDEMITGELEKVRRLSQKIGMRVSIPLPWDMYSSNRKDPCLTFWTRFQVLPDRNLLKD